MKSLDNKKVLCVKIEGVVAELFLLLIFLINLEKQRIT